MHPSCTHLLSVIFFITLATIEARMPREFTFQPSKKSDIDTYSRNSSWLELDETNKTEIESHLHRFGYLPHYGESNSVSDAELESALAHYQTKLGLPVTGKLDSDTLYQILTPRCGVRDTEGKTTRKVSFHAKQNYVYFPGRPRWARDIPMTLTYAFSPENLIAYLQPTDLRSVFARAFSKWSSVIPVGFVETQDYGFADIKIGFFSGDHGDGEPFDGVLGVLAHSFSPESGRLHLDEDETWAVDFEKQKSAVAVDLESVAVHEIGHVLGLGHSSVKDAVMYPSLKPRDKKADLAIDDIKGVQALYGTNPNFKLSALLASDTSANRAGYSIMLRSFHFFYLTSMIFTLTFLFN